jgi:hypothetical protein
MCIKVWHVSHVARNRHERGPHALEKPSGKPIWLAPTSKHLHRTNVGLGPGLPNVRFLHTIQPSLGGSGHRRASHFGARVDVQS